MVWQCYESAVRAALRARDTERPDERSQDILVCVLLAVATAETFLNIFFRIVVEETGYTQHKDRLLKDLTPPFLGLEGKLKQWPKDIFGDPLDLESGIGKEFQKLKNKRNTLMHFTSSYDTLSLPDNITIKGLANTEVFDSLTVEDAFKAIDIIERFIKEILRLKGRSIEKLPSELHFWTGKVPEI
jgi:hypothetical protein